MAHIFIDACENWSDLHAVLIMQDYILVIFLLAGVTGAEKDFTTNEPNQDSIVTTG